MFDTRRDVLTVFLVAVLALAAAVLFDVLGTVFFAVTVAYLVAPVHRRVVERGVPQRVAAAAVTVGAVVVAFVPVAIGSYLVYRRREEVFDALTHLPDSVSVTFGGVTYAAAVEPLRATVQGWVSSLAVTVAREIPVLGLKAALFAVLVFGLLVRQHDAAAALLAPVDPSYHDIVARVHERVRSTLFAIYVLQAATALGTFAFALPVFVALGYPFAVTLAFLCGALQFLPVVGPSLVILALAAYQFSVGAVLDAVLVAAVGMVVIAGLPDLLIRPRLASETTDLPGSLYFVGFVGGLLTLGPVGVIAGPLVAALVVEAGTLLAEENGQESRLRD